MIGADPAGSVYSGGTGRPYLVEGVGEDFWPETYDRGVADRVIEVSDADSFAFTRRLAREEALLVGGSCGMAAYAARQLAHELAGTPEGRDAVDRGAAARLRPRLPHQDLQRRLAGPVRLRHRRARPPARTVGEVLRGKSGRLPDLVHTHPSETVAEAVAILQEYGVSQMPVVRAEPPIVAAEVAGSVSDRGPARRAVRRPRPAHRPGRGAHVARRCRRIGSTEAAADAVALLEAADAVLVQEDGKPVGVLTRQDLLAFLSL